MIKKYFALSAVAASVAIAGCSDDDDPVVPDTDTNPVVVPATPGEGGSAYDTIFGSTDHTTLLAAINSVDGLKETLDDPANVFTIFAPTNAAFDALIAADDEDAFTETADFLAPANQAALVNILNYHVVEGTVTATDIATLLADDDTTNDSAATLLANGNLTFAVTSTDPLATSGYDVVDDAGNPVALNTESIDQGLATPSTGVTHFIDAVLTPPELAVTPDPDPGPDGPAPSGAADTALSTNGNYEIARSAITEFFAGSMDTNTWTFFLPSDTILAAAGVTELTAAQLQDHIFTNGAVAPADLAALTAITPSSNNTYPVTNENGMTTVNGFEVNLLTEVSVGQAQVYSIAGVLAAAE